MREYLFRGKRVDNGKWVEGYYVYDESGQITEEPTAYICYLNTHPCGWSLIPCAIIPETIGQCTGLNDKNGKKIFEGDIIQFGINRRLVYVHWNDETLTWELTDVGVSIYEVNHLINTFDLAEIQVESAYGEVFSEIVGNIFDNADLLEG